MDVPAGRDEGHAVRTPPEAGGILPDRTAPICFLQGPRRARPPEQLPRLHFSPATVLELQFLAEVGRIRFARQASPATLAASERWRLDDPPSGRWFAAACDVSWTRDPFDRLLAAHARLRGWKLATADAALLGKMPA